MKDQAEQPRRVVRRKLPKFLKGFGSKEVSGSGRDMKSPTGYLVGDNHFGCCSSGTDESTQRPDNSNIAEAETTLRERGSLNYEEARALLGRIEYQKGNIAAALQVFEGIDVASVTPKIATTLAGHGNRRQQPFNSSPLSAQGASLLLEAMFLKAKSLQLLNRFEEAAQSCKVILDIIESSFPEGFPENFTPDCKLLEIVTKAFELLPELWRAANFLREAIISYRHALLRNWNFSAQTRAKMQMDLCILLLYGGYDASSPELRTLMDKSFVPRNNVEEAILLLMIMLKNVSEKVIEWNPSILDHLCYALSVTSGTSALALEVERIFPDFIERREGMYTLALSYCGTGDESVALNLLRKLLHLQEDPTNIPGLLLASRLCSDKPELAEEGTGYLSRALENPENYCCELRSVAMFLLGISLSSQCKSEVSCSEKNIKQLKALESLEAAARMTKMQDANVLYYLALENAHQRKLNAAHRYATDLIKLENGSDVRGWLLLSRILAAQSQHSSAETVINAALDQTSTWDQGQLLRTKAKLQVAQGQVNNAINSYIQLLASLKVQSKSYRYVDKAKQSSVRRLEQEVWHDLATVYISLSRWSDAEACLANARSMGLFSAASIHTTGLLCEGKSAHKDAQKQFMRALDIDPTFAPSLVSTATSLSHVGNQTSSIVTNFLVEALRQDRTNYSAWYNLGLVYKDKGDKGSTLEAAECFQAAVELEESSPVEPF